VSSHLFAAAHKRRAGAILDDDVEGAAGQEPLDIASDVGR
jgi:hypothetical protein